MPFANPAGIASDGGVWVYPKSAHPKDTQCRLGYKITFIPIVFNPLIVCGTSVWCFPTQSKGHRR